MGVILIITILGGAYIDHKERESEGQLDLFNMQAKEQLSRYDGNFTLLQMQRIDGAGYTTAIRVFHDNKRNVTCWEFRQGLSCIPDHLLVGEVEKKK